jgi:MFS family permease
MNFRERFLPKVPGVVIAVGFVSLLTDLSSEMVPAYLPAFMSLTLGAGVWALGLIEGVAEFTASVLKLYSGLWSDRVTRRKPMVVLGYGLSSLLRPLMGLAPSWPVVLLFRFSDRVGKGLRSSPRDTIIAASTPPEARGTAYGFERSMDHAGALLSGLLASGLIALGLSIGHMFLLAAVPGVVVMWTLIVKVKEPVEIPADLAAPKPVISLRGAWASFDPKLKWVYMSLIFFTLGNSSDVFLVKRLQDSGVPIVWLGVLWSAFHLVKMTTTYLGGRLADKLPKRRLVLAGWFWYALVYLAMGWLKTEAALIGIFMAYGIYYGLTEPVEKAWVVDMAPAGLRGSALGFYNAVVGMMGLPASFLCGLIWQWKGPAYALGFGAVLAFAAGLMLFGTTSSKNAGAPGAAEPA